MANTWAHNNKVTTSAIAGGLAGVAANKFGGLSVGESVAVAGGVGVLSFLILDATEDKAPAHKSISLGDIGEARIEESDLGVEVTLLISKEEIPGITRKAIEKKLRKLPKSERAEMAQRLIAQFVAKQAAA